MAHELDGDWTSRVIKGTTLMNDELPQIHLEIDPATGDLKPGSNQGGHRLTGKVTKQGSLHSVEINNGVRPRRYEGIFCARINGAGGPRLVIAGRLRLNPPVRLTADQKEQNADAAGRPGGSGKTSVTALPASQDQIIWVATKP